MRRFLSIAIFIILCIHSFAQIDTIALQHKADSLYKIVEQKYSVGDYKGAVDLLIEAEPIDEVLSSVEYHAEYITNVGTVYFYIGDKQNAINYYIKASDFIKKSLGDTNINYAQSLSNVGLLYSTIGEYPDARSFFAKASEIYNKINATESADYASLLTNIGNLNYYLGNYANAIDYYTQSLKIKKKTIGDNHPDYATSLNNIGLVFTKMGNYYNALKYYQQSAKIWKDNYGEDNRDFLTAISNIADLYANIGDYQKSLKYNLQVLEIRKKVLGEEHLDYTRTLINIGEVYFNLGDFDNALKYNQQALETIKRNFGETHLYYAESLNSIGVIYSDEGDYQTALKYYTQAMEIKKNMQGSQSPGYAESANNVGLAYLHLGNNDTAMKYFNEALEIYENTLGKQHNDYALTLNNIGYSYYKMNNAGKAVVFNDQALTICKNNLVRNFSFMTARERESYWNTNKLVFNNGLFYSFNTDKDTLADKDAYNIELIQKGLLLASEISLTNIIMESGDDALIAEYNDFRRMNQELNSELEKTISERTINCDSLAVVIQMKERRIIERSKEFGDATNFININWKDVQKSLKANDVAIEFSTHGNAPDTIKYAAIVLTKDMDAPVCVTLFNQFEMQKLQRGIAPAKTETSTDEENRGATTVASKRQGIYESTGLYNLLWKPLEKYFPENPRIYFAPSGMLHQIAVEYAPIDHEKTISDKYEIYRVSSTRYIAMDYMPTPMKNTVLYGGIYYDSDTTIMKQESDKYSTRSATYTSFADLNRNEDRGGLSYLPGTKTEVEDIFGKLKRKKVKTTLYEGSQANEESFKALSGNEISTLHIATHGFFLPTDEKISGDQSLIQSGLLLSGANYAWQNQPLPEGVEDGILTAKEISFMDLRKTDLVVLSACQTALGEITGEGVFGLQRGFKKAGVRTIIMSLWPVDDNATLLMMTEFYANLTKGMTKREAFLAAQNKVKTTVGFENPRYWAAFIMLDGNE